MSIFEELVALDRPYINFNATISGIERPFLARRLSAADQDAIEAYFSDEYARQVLTRTESVDGKPSEIERVKVTYLSRPRTDLIAQILGTRAREVNARTFTILGEDYRERATASEDIKDIDERTEVQKQLVVEIDAARVAANLEFASEYEYRTDEELADIMSQINVNYRAQTEAASRRNSRNLHYILHTLDKERVFPTAESVEQLSQETIISILDASTKAFEMAVSTDLPFALPAAPERDKPSSSQSNLVGATKRSGKRTRTLQSV